MKCNRNKHEVLHSEKKNQMHMCRIGDTWIGNDTCEKDHEIPVDHKLDMNKQCYVAFKKVFTILNCNNRSVMSKSQKIIYLVRPHLENSFQFWESCFRKDL